jgi:hypothetical protein
MERTKGFLDQIIDYECGMLNDQEALQMFSDMIKTGMVWSLQGHYGRTASYLMENGWLDENGNILIEKE